MDNNMDVRRSSLHLYLDSISDMPLFTAEDEKKYGQELLLRDKISIFVKKMVYTDKFVKTLDLESILVSLKDSDNAKDIYDLLYTYYSSKNEGIGSIIRDYLVEYDFLFKKLNRYPNKVEMRDYFMDVKPRGAFSKFDKVRNIEDNDLLEQVNYFIRYNIAFDKFVNSNLRLVAIFVNRFKKTGINMDTLDIISEGNLGLIRAVEKFDINLGRKFSTYAAYWIKQSISRAIMEKYSTIRVPSYLVAEYNSFLKKVEDGSLNNLSLQEIADKLHISKDRINAFESIQNYIAPISLDQKIRDNDDDDETLMHFVSDPSMNVEDIVVSESMREDINKLLSSLTEDEKKVILLRNGFYDEEIYTLSEIGKMMRVSREGVRKKEARALKKMRNKIYDKRDGSIINEYLY